MGKCIDYESEKTISRRRKGVPGILDAREIGKIKK